MASFSTYQSKLRDGLPTKDDANWVEELLGKFMNRQTPLFMRWLNIKLPTKKDNRNRLVVITPLRIILIKTKTFGRSVHRKYRIIDIIGVNVNNNDNKYTECIITQCDFPPELSISRSREKLKNKEYQQQNIKIFLPKDIDREFLDILQWSLFIVTRGLPNKFKPKIKIPDTFKNDISDPVGPGQFVIDRYVAYCDAQNKNSGAGIAASEEIIEYTLGSVTSGVFDINLAFNKTSKKIDNLQFVCLSSGLAFSKVYKKLVLNQLSSLDDTNMAILMTLFETNYDIKILEFRRVDVQSKTMRSLSSALSCTNGLTKLQEINIIDININKNIVLSLSNGLSYIKLKVLRLTNCYLSKTATIQLFNILQKTEQHKHITHLNLSKNQCGRQGTKAISAFLNKTTSLQVLVVADAQLDGNEFFNALTMDSSNNKLSHLDTLTLLDFSGNNIGDKGAQYLAKFIELSRCLNYLKLSRCNINTQQLQRIFAAGLKNMQGFEKGKYNPKFGGKQYIKPRPTHCDIMLCTNLLCLSFDLSDNGFGTKGADVICNLLKQRENYTIVSLNLAKNNFNVQDMKHVITNLPSLACLERLCISENVKRGIGKKTDKEGIIGKSLLYLFQQTPTLNELAITGSESSNCYLDVGLQHFLRSINKISNLEFLDFSGNKIGDKLFIDFLKGLQNNQTLRLVRCNDNRLSSEIYISYLELLSSHPTVIGKIPSDDSSKKNKNKKYSSLRDAAKQNLRQNKQQFEIDRQMMTSLPREHRLEKELRRPCGTQYGITIERIRGTVQYPDYACRIPQVLVKLKNLLEARGGFETVGIFRIQPDAKEFPIVRQALNTNNFEFRINDINCIANAIKVWFRELPIKVLTPISKERVVKCSSQNEVGEIINTLMEPYKSVFEWLLDLAVQVVENSNKNKMDAKNMAVVLCPNLYENSTETQDALHLQSALLRFTEFAIRHRIEFRKNNPIQEINDAFAIKAGLAPGIADQNALAIKNKVPILSNDDDDEDVDERKNNDMLDGEGDGFAGGAAYSGSRFRGASQVNEASSPVNQMDNNKYLGGVDDNKEMLEDIPPAAYSDYGDDDDNEEEHFGDIDPNNAGHQAKNMSIAIEHDKVKNIAAKLAIDPTAMRPGNKGPPKRKIQKNNDQNREIDSSANLSRPAQQKKKKKKKKGKKKQLLLESMVDNYSEASAAAKVPEPDEKEPEPIRRQSHHVPMESKVLGGFVQPGLAMLARQTSAEERDENKKNKHKKQDTESDDELIPALAHLDSENANNENNQQVNIVDYVYEEKQFVFDTKPMGFQIEAENGKISVRSVRKLSQAGQYNVQPKWDIVAVNGFRDWSSMLGILESSLGPFDIIFAVPTQIINNNALEKSLSNNSSGNLHPIPPASAPVNLPPPPEQEEIPQMDVIPPYAPPAENEYENNQPQQDMISSQQSMISVSAPADDEMKDSEYKSTKRNFDMMSRNSSAIAKEVLNEYDQDENDKQIKCDGNIFNSSTNMQQKEYNRLESVIKKFQNKNAQLLETLQVIRLKGEMERIELDNAKVIQMENNKLKKELNDKIKPLKAQLKNSNKQIQTQRQLMYQYANLLRRHKIPIPELQASLHENESSSESDSDSSD